MASENLAKLQATTNRFASVVGFSPLVIDGGMGAKTEEAIVRVLNFIESGCKQQCVGPNTQQAASVALVNISPTTIMQQNVGLNQLFNGVAELLSMPAAALVAIAKPTANTTTPDRSAFAVKPPPTMGVIDRTRLWFRQQTMPVKAAMGIGGAIGAMALWGMVSKKKAKAGVAGRW